MSSTSRLYRDDELRESYEAQQYAFANQASGASAGTTHIETTGPFRGVKLPAYKLPQHCMPIYTDHQGHDIGNTCEREPTDDELRAIEREQARTFTVNMTGSYPLNDYPPLPI